MDTNVVISSAIDFLLKYNLSADIAKSLFVGAMISLAVSTKLSIASLTSAQSPGETIPAATALTNVSVSYTHLTLPTKRIV